MDIEVKMSLLTAAKEGIMNFTYDLTNIFGSLVNFGTDKEFGNNEDSGNNPLKLKKKEFIRKDGDKFMIIKYDHDIISNDMRDTTGLFRSLIFKNGKLVGHTDNYIKIHVRGDTSLINTIQRVNILNRKNEYMIGQIN